MGGETYKWQSECLDFSYAIAHVRQYYIILNIQNIKLFYSLNVSEEHKTLKPMWSMRMIRSHWMINWNLKLN